MIHFDHVTKVYESNGTSFKAVNDVELRVEKGEIFGVIGFSGAGKSTLIRLVNLLESPTSGSVLLNGRDMASLKKSELREQRRKIGMIFQHFNLLESKNVYHNVAFPLSLAGVPKKEIDSRVTEILEFVGLSDKSTQYPDQLSGGQKQRVGIARALATSPEILLCDEATSALDPETTKSILDLLKRVRDEYNITILMITHEMNVIREICDQVAVMEQGKLIEQGTIFDVFSNPKHQTTKNFVRTVMQDEIPGSILRLLSDQERSRHIYRITFVNETTGEPILSRVSKRFDVEVNVLHGQITELQGVPFGNLIVELQGEQSEILKAIHFLQTSVQLKEVSAHAG